ncbi:hypothetical protein AB0D49_33000 [Streptomyces sp. NPDC048290]|uniref:hypothetical protein n=1 Tax=Streptomyces sp. NPDC048290 TaxID=3155811 RepID=UPI00343BD13B
MDQSPLIRTLLEQKGWGDYTVFKARYEEAARYLAQTEGPVALATASIDERQFQRWKNGELKSLPRREARQILRHLFPGVPVEALFAPVPGGTDRPDRAGGAEHRASRGVRRGPAPDLPAGVADTVSQAADESAAFAARCEATNIGPHTLEQLEADIRRLVTTYPNRPVGPVFTEVRALRDRTFTLLEGRQPPAYSRDLYVAAGVLCGVLANASFDLGNYSAAQTQARTAFLCGELAGHHGLRAWVRGLQALIAYWDGRPRDAVGLADAGAVFVPEAGTAHIRLASIKARALGQLQEAAAAADALRHAAELREQLTTGDDLPGGMMAFPREKELFYASSTHLWLGGDHHVATAARHAQDAVTGFEAAPPGERRLGEWALARMDLATARLAQGELDGAADQIHEVLGVSARRGTESVRKRLTQFSRGLARHPAASSPHALALREAIAAHQSSRPAELPPGAPA